MILEKALEIVSAEENPRGCIFGSFAVREGLTPELMQRLMLYNWPGNVRELENTIECAMDMTHQIAGLDSSTHLR